MQNETLHVLPQKENLLIWALFLSPVIPAVRRLNVHTNYFSYYVSHQITDTESMYSMSSRKQILSAHILFNSFVLNIGLFSLQLLVLDMLSDRSLSIPVLEGSPNSEFPESNCGIHSIKISPAGTLLATSGQNPNNLAVYRLPTFDPMCVGEVCTV